MQAKSAAKSADFAHFFEPDFRWVFVHDMRATLPFVQQVRCATLDSEKEELPVKCPVAKAMQTCAAKADQMRAGEETPPDSGPRASHHAGSSSKVLACFKSSVSKPSVNQP